MFRKKVCVQGKLELLCDFVATEACSAGSLASRARSSLRTYSLSELQPWSEPYKIGYRLICSLAFFSLTWAYAKGRDLWILPFLKQVRPFQDRNGLDYRRELGEFNKSSYRPATKNDRAISTKQHQSMSRGFSKQLV